MLYTTDNVYRHFHRFHQQLHSKHPPASFPPLLRKHKQQKAQKDFCL
ncbi:MAG: hypothetical protein E7508_01005 [Ruminococcus sp.]|nr:hypothetical protein [Ruminococcus sp.]